MVCCRCSRCKQKRKAQEGSIYETWKVLCVWVFVSLWCTKKNKNKKKNSSKKKGLWIFRVSVFHSFFCVFVPSLPFYYHINIAHRCISLAWIYQDKKKCVSFKKLFLFFLMLFFVSFFWKYCTYNPDVTDKKGCFVW